MPFDLTDCPECGGSTADNRLCPECAGREARVRAHYATNPVRSPAPARRACRLCYRKTTTHGYKMYEIKPGQFLCAHDLALVAQQASLLWPDVVRVTREIESWLSE